MCKLTKYVRNCVVFWKNLHSWQKFYTTAGRDGRDKFQVWVHYTRRAPVHQFSVTLHCTSVLALHWCACTTPVCLQCTSVTVHCTTSTCISPPCILKPQGIKSQRCILCLPLHQMHCNVLKDNYNSNIYCHFWQTGVTAERKAKHSYQTTITLKVFIRPLKSCSVSTGSLKGEQVAICSCHTWSLSFFLHWHNFWRIKSTPKKRVNYAKIHRKLPIFCVITAKYTVNCQFFALNL